MIKLSWVFGFLMLWPPSLMGQLSIEGFTGPVYMHSVDVKISQPGAATDLTFHDVGFRGEPFTPPMNYGVRLGMPLSKSRMLRVEIEFFHNKAYARHQKSVWISGILRGQPVSARMPMESIVQRFSISHGANLFLANLVISRRFKKMEGHARLGLGLSIPHTESTVEGIAQEQYETLFPAAQIALGVSAKLVGPMRVVAEYKFAYASASKVKIAGGHASTRIWAHHWVGGLGFCF